MAKGVPLSLRLEPETRAGIERAAREEQRNLTNMIGKALSDWLKERGYDRPALAPRARKAKAEGRVAA